jgi:hypothetical protein
LLAEGREVEGVGLPAEAIPFGGKSAKGRPHLKVSKLRALLHQRGLELFVRCGQMSDHLAETKAVITGR